jgi:serpin B
MLVLLPSPSNTVADVEAKLGGPWLDGLLSREWYGKATIAMPKFDIRSEHDLKSLFSAAGMSGAFDEWDADFGGIASGIHLSAAVQKTAVSVDEEGTTAMATTSALGRPLGILRNEPREFIADRPFLFLIRESRTGLVLFLGKVCNPAALNPDDESHAENAEDAEPKSRAEGAEPATP